MRVILKAANRELGLPMDSTEGVAYFDTSEHATYTEEEPNALRPERVDEFLACMREVFPQHYAMTYLGFATGLRPSSMRPLRRKGPTPDVRWDEGVVLVRRSHTLVDEVMDTTRRAGCVATFNDLARTARVETLVTKSISGHITDRMREHYSTVQPTEQRESIGRVLRLVAGGPVTDGNARGGAPGGALTSRVVLREEGETG